MGFRRIPLPERTGQGPLIAKMATGEKKARITAPGGRGEQWDGPAKHDEADIIRFMKKHRLSRRIWTLSTEQLACYGQEEVRPMAFHSETDAKMVRGCVELTRNASPRASDCAAVGPALTTPCIRLLTARHVNPVTCSATASVGLASSAGTLF